jgi:hypothetical protein
VGPTVWRGMEGLEKWRLRWEIWRSMQNEDLFRGPAGVGFLHKTSKFWSRGTYGDPHWSCSNQWWHQLLGTTRAGYRRPTPSGGRLAQPCVR